jgi:hypothetical protein
MDLAMTLRICRLMVSQMRLADTDGAVWLFSSSPDAAALVGVIHLTKPSRSCAPGGHSLAAVFARVIWSLASELTGLPIGVAVSSRSAPQASSCAGPPVRRKPAPASSVASTAHPWRHFSRRCLTGEAEQDRPASFWPCSTWQTRRWRVGHPWSSWHRRPSAPPEIDAMPRWRPPWWRGSAHSTICNHAPTDSRFLINATLAMPAFMRALRPSYRPWRARIQRRNVRAISRPTGLRVRSVHNSGAHP